MQPAELAGFPLWLTAVLVAGAAVLGAVLVEFAVRAVIPARLREAQTSVATAIFTVIGTTYAVLLAFVAMLALERFDQAQAVTDAEASLVQNVYLLIDGLSGPEMGGMRNDVIRYTQAVIGQEWPEQARGGRVAEEQADLARLTRTALHLRPDNLADGNLDTLLLTDLTNLGTARRERLLAARTVIPGILWFVLVAGGGISVGFASFLGTPSLRMHLAMSSLLALSGALVLIVILALSNPFRGDFRISVEPFTRVLGQMRGEPSP